MLQSAWGKTSLTFLPLQHRGSRDPAARPLALLHHPISPALQWPLKTKGTAFYELGKEGGQSHHFNGLTNRRLQISKPYESGLSHLVFFSPSFLWAMGGFIHNSTSRTGPICLLPFHHAKEIPNSEGRGGVGLRYPYPQVHTEILLHSLPHHCVTRFSWPQRRGQRASSSSLIGLERGGSGLLGNSTGLSPDQTLGPVSHSPATLLWQSRFSHIRTNYGNREGRWA